MLVTAKRETMKNVAIVGGGITGSIAASLLSKAHNNVNVHLFDQGRSGVGGRSSTRDNMWDHGCQFFRADTPRFRAVVDEWCRKGICKEWTGNFASDDAHTGSDNDHSFFGFPSLPPFYIGINGMQSIPKLLLEQAREHSGASGKLSVHTGTQVSGMKRNKSTKQWTLLGTVGTAAFHDTPEKDAKSAAESVLGNSCCFDAILLTDVSSSFGGWHRASAGVPDEFSARVRQRVGARVPLFSAMVTFEQPLAVGYDAKCFTTDDTLWFAGRSSSKGISTGTTHNEDTDCWTLVSTPNYALDQITSTPMQDPLTGEFIPQPPDYLTTIPGPDLLKAFQANNAHIKQFPKVTFLNAQRWGSALPCHRHLNNDDNISATRRVVANVPYDIGRAPLAPTTRRSDDDLSDYIADELLGLYQAGDMMTRFTPGFEGAALSGMDAADCILKDLAKNYDESLTDIFLYVLVHEEKTHPTDAFYDDESLEEGAYTCWF